MKKLKKIVMILKDTSGETMVEVIVAFTLLSIMMVVFSQGLASATTSEVNAKKNRDNADVSMLFLQKKLVSDNPTVSGTVTETINGTEESKEITVTQKEIKIADITMIQSNTYTIDGDTTYVVFKPVTS